MIVKNKIIAHRGASMYAPENSASSLKLASSMGVEWIETDVQITIDNKLVIFHDEKLNRTSNGEGPAAAVAKRPASAGAPQPANQHDDPLTHADAAITPHPATTPIKLCW